MDDDFIEQVEQFVAEQEPVTQDELEAEFGRRGVIALRILMRDSRVSHNTDGAIQTES